MYDDILKDTKIDDLRKLLDEWERYDPRIQKVIDIFVDRNEKSDELLIEAREEIIKLREKLKNKDVDVEAELEDEEDI